MNSPWTQQHDQIVAKYVTLHPYESPKKSAFVLVQIVTARFVGSYRYDQLLKAVLYWRYTYDLWYEKVYEK